MSTTVLISTQHADYVSHKEIEEAVTELIIRPTIPAEYLDNELKIFVNPTGRFVIGGPMGDAGVTGRKIIGRYLWRHGPATVAAAFSGQRTPQKVDRLSRLLLPVWACQERRCCRLGRTFVRSR